MTDWKFAVERAIQRAKAEDLGAVAAREGILGLPLSVNSAKATRVYETASEARQKHNQSLLNRGRQPLAVGKTGYPDLDKQLEALTPVPA